MKGMILLVAMIIFEEKCGETSPVARAQGNRGRKRALYL